MPMLLCISLTVSFYLFVNLYATKGPVPFSALSPVQEPASDEQASSGNNTLGHIPSAMRIQYPLSQTNLQSRDPDEILGNIGPTASALKRAGVTDTIGDPGHANEDRPIGKRAKSANPMPNPFLSEEDAWKDFAFFSALGQDIQWCSAREIGSANKIDYLADFKEYQRKTGDSLATDMIADVSVGGNEPGSFSKWLQDRHGRDGLKEARFKPQAFKTIEDKWPSWVEVTNRVFAKDVKTYRDVCKKAAAEPNQEEPIAVYVNCVLHS